MKSIEIDENLETVHTHTHTRDLNKIENIKYRNYSIFSLDVSKLGIK